MRVVQAKESQVRYAKAFSGVKFGDLTCHCIDRVQPSCGWCTRNGQLCEYRERKKPGLRAGYGKELEQRLGKSNYILQFSHISSAS